MLFEHDSEYPTLGSCLVGLVPCTTLECVREVATRVITGTELQNVLVAITIGLEDTVELRVVECTAGTPCHCRPSSHVLENRRWFRAEQKPWS